jgi:hypothetical protein
MRLSNEISHTREIISNAQASAIILAAAAITSLSVPVVFNNLPKAVKLLYFAAGMGCAAGQIAVVKKNERLFALGKVHDNFEKKGIADELTVTQQTDAALSKMKGLELLTEIVDCMPAHKRARYIHEFNLKGLIHPNVPTGTQQTAIQAESQAIIVKHHPQAIDAKVAKLLNIDWFDESFIWGGGGVIGKAGSGKSSLMQAWGASILASVPETDFTYCNVSYHPKADRLFPQLPENIEVAMTISDPMEIYNRTESVYLEMIRRQKVGDRESPPIFLIIDEWIGLYNRLGKDLGDQLVKWIFAIVFEGRKWAKQLPNKIDTGIRVLLVMHSGKKDLTGVGSDFYNAGQLVLFDNAVSDPNTPFPSDFDRKKLTMGIHALNSVLISAGLIDPNNRNNCKARSVVLRKADCEPEIVPMPYIDVTKIPFQVVDEFERVDHYPDTPLPDASKYPGENYLIQLRNWYIAGNRQATGQEIKQQIELLAEKTITDDILANVMEFLNGSENNGEN